MRSAIEEHENARRVLEHTISDQLPRVEARLGEARELLSNRDMEITDLAGSTTRQQQALAEARAINAQQRAEIERLTTSLTVRGGRSQQSLTDPGASAEIALRAEIEGLRAKTRDQAALIARLQQDGEAAPAAGTVVPMPGRMNGSLVSELPSGLMGVLPPDEIRSALERDLRTLKAKSEDQAAEIKTLSAELTALRSAEAANTPDSKVALRARLTGLQTQADQQAEQLRKVRAELAAANERLALQGAHFMEQMRRLGAAATPAAGQPRRPDAAAAPRVSLAERVANSRSPSASSADKAASDASSDSAQGAGEPANDAKPASQATTPRLIDRISSLSKA